MSRAQTQKKCLQLNDADAWGVLLEQTNWLRVARSPCTSPFLHVEQKWMQWHKEKICFFVSLRQERSVLTQMPREILDDSPCLCLAENENSKIWWGANSSSVTLHSLPPLCWALTPLKPLTDARYRLAMSSPESCTPDTSRRERMLVIKDA